MNTGSEIKYRPNGRKLQQLFISGFTATIAMLGLSYLLLASGVSAIDYAGQIGTVLNGGFIPEPFSTTWWAGLGLQTVLGTFLFSVLFDYLAHQKILPTDKWVKGLLYGTAVWFLTSAVVAPLANQGMFFRLTSTPAILTFANLVCWLGYGMVLDGMTRVRVVHSVAGGVSEQKQVA